MFRDQVARRVFESSLALSLAGCIGFMGPEIEEAEEPNWDADYVVIPDQEPCPPAPEEPSGSVRKKPPPSNTDVRGVEFVVVSPEPANFGASIIHGGVMFEERPRRTRTAASDARKTSLRAPR